MVEHKCAHVHLTDVFFSDCRFFSPYRYFSHCVSMLYGCRYSKMHLFDIDIPGKIRFQESEVLSAGESIGVFELSPGVKVGLGICYDIRFAELSMILTRYAVVASRH